MSRGGSVRLGIVSITLLLAAVLVMGQGGGRPPQSTAIPRIGVIDTEKILLSSSVGKKAVQELKAFQQKRESEVAQQAAQVSALQQRSRDAAAAGSANRETIANELRAAVATLEARRSEAKKEVEAKKEAMLQQIDAEAMPTINTMGKEMGYTLIFRKFESGLIFADDKVDITEAIIRRLDEPGRKAFPG